MTEKRGWWEGEQRPMDGPSCPGCGLPNYSGLCGVCRGNEQEAVDQGLPYPWDDEDIARLSGEPT